LSEQYSVEITKTVCGSWLRADAATEEAGHTARDNLNTHTIGAFYTAFKPARARTFVSRIEFHCTPKHGSWLNIAENELNCVTSQCVAGRRIGSEAELREETTAWYEDINAIQRGIDWQMKIDDARIKLKSIYPQIKLRQTIRSL